MAAPKSVVCNAACAAAGRLSHAMSGCVPPTVVVRPIAWSIGKMLSYWISGARPREREAVGAAVPAPVRGWAHARMFAALIKISANNEFLAQIYFVWTDASWRDEYYKVSLPQMYNFIVDFFEVPREGSEAKKRVTKLLGGTNKTFPITLPRLASTAAPFHRTTSSRLSAQQAAKERRV
ncbi:hypothetical protein B0H14DRAFT_3584446 [Mycena olivaceomarginata]|nr:hypothetical protein B0H14DRAFT_3584446 [Mycena olivaceomarginata]